MLSIDAFFLSFFNSCLKPITAGEQQKNLALVVETSSCSVKNGHRISIPISCSSPIGT